METLASYRSELNRIDEQIVALLGERMNVCRRVALFKRENGIDMMQPARVEEVKERCARIAARHRVDPAFVRNLYSMIIAETCRLEDEIIESA